ncbi:hypothetical protein GF1_09650 [Desulfolithobacter dissulfuricans]|uniref:Uncharacterized protein n=1 Tax=Desulfolithobacter dissulfuricans TaxID=2795293 RepID=A0A915U062_9BACT|nr:hypothetical protein [Desulfolithobacter dissulfuricans]BCO08589.1 hypothetical protein GF1_09650 [Desulfolithobacter dissulfuricans]
MSLFLDVILYKIACLIWTDKQEDVNPSDEYYFWLEEFVEDQARDDLPF